MKSFSERKGLKEVSSIIQIDSMNAALLNSLWNALDITIWSTEGFLYKKYGVPEIESFSKTLWFSYFKKPIDTRPDNNYDKLNLIRDYFFKCPWNEVYDFLEFVVSIFSRTKPKIAENLNYVLERELSGYRLVSGQLVDITNKEELEMLDEVLRDNRFAGVSGHLRRALELYSDREHPDYRNSIKESISAVESMARVVAEAPKATLGDALKVIERSNKLHPALKEAFLKLYGYTSDEHGIRHAMLDEPNIYAADARFFLLSCTSFVNYLKSQLP